MTHWFGPETWNAPICRDCPRDPIPVGTPCARCGVAITERDSGVVIPHMEDTVTRKPWHLDCHIKSVMPHTMWPVLGLKPDPADIIDGVFECPSCKMRWEEGRGWRGFPVGMATTEDC